MIPNNTTIKVHADTQRNYRNDMSPAEEIANIQADLVTSRKVLLIGTNS